MEWMTKIILLNFINQDDFYDGVQRNIDHMRAHAFE